MPAPRLRTLRDGSVRWQVRYRLDGVQTSDTFTDETAALKFSRAIDELGLDRAVAGLIRQRAVTAEATFAEWADRHIRHLTAVEGATRKRYRSYLVNDVASLAALRLSDITRDEIADWVNELQASGASGKTIRNKHGFVSAVMNSAVRAGKIDANPCADMRLPRSESEMTFLTPDEFEAIRVELPARWRPLATWLATTGMRFGEATALTMTDIDLSRRTCRINKAWKYTGSGQRSLGRPKTRRSVRTIDLPTEAVNVLDPTRRSHELAFVNSHGTAITSQVFWATGWRDAVEAAGLAKRPRVHDLRHTCASWMVSAGVPLPIVQRHLGHESITTTVDRYSHHDRRASRVAADAVTATMRGQSCGAA